MLSALQFFLLGLVILVDNVHTTCIGNTEKTEIILVTRSEMISRECYCNLSSTVCSWSPFANRNNTLSSGISESLLQWRNDTGYGQYICMQDNSFIVNDVFILPERSREESCDNCFSARVCMTIAGTYLSITRFFNHLLLEGPCELYLNSEIAHYNITDNACVELSSNSNYTIVCPVCSQNVNAEIYYEIPNNIFNSIEDCSNSGICSIGSQQTSTTAMVNTVAAINLSVSPTSNIPSTYAPSLEPSTSSILSTGSTMEPSTSSILSKGSTMEPSTSPIFSTATMTAMPTIPGMLSTNDNDNNLRNILIGVASAVAVIVVIAAILIIVKVYLQHHRQNHSSCTGEEATTPDNIVNKALLPSEVELQALNRSENQDHDDSTVTAEGNTDPSSEADSIVSKILNCNASQLINAIKESHPVINKHIQFETLLQHFNSHKIFTNAEMDYFSANSKSLVKKVNKLIIWLEKKDDSGIYNFVKALNKETEHSGHYTILKKLHEILFPVTTE